MYLGRRDGCEGGREGATVNPFFLLSGSDLNSRGSVGTNNCRVSWAPSAVSAGLSQHMEPHLKFGLRHTEAAKVCCKQARRRLPKPIEGTTVSSQVTLVPYFQGDLGAVEAFLRKLRDCRAARAVTPPQVSGDGALLVNLEMLSAALLPPCSSAPV